MSSSRRSSAASGAKAAAAADGNVGTGDASDGSNSGKHGAGGNVAPHFWRNMAAFVVVVLAGFGGMYAFFKSVPGIDSVACAETTPKRIYDAIGIPLITDPVTDVERAQIMKNFSQCAKDYDAEHPYVVIAAYCIVYIVLQAFAIPGPIVLSVLAGAVYDQVPAQLLIAVCATTGASLCFGISYILGTDITAKLIPGWIDTFKGKVETNKDNLWYYLFFLRVTPMLPNWFVNVASPVVGVPFYKFFIATLFGLMPANFFHVQTGAELATVTELSFKNAGVLVKLFLLQFVVLAPTLFKSKIAAYEARKFPDAGADGSGVGSGEEEKKRK